MAYDAVSAYTVLFGDGDGPARVSVHGSAEDAWRTLEDLVRGSQRPGRGRPGRRSGRRSVRGGSTGDVGTVDEADVRAVAEAWRHADPSRRYWQVAPHRLQVTVPAIALD